MSTNAPAGAECLHHTQLFLLENPTAVSLGKPLDDLLHTKIA